MWLDKGHISPQNQISFKIKNKRMMIFYDIIYIVTLFVEQLSPS